MARCERCDAPESMWNTNNCKYCNYPATDTRTPEQIETDRKDYIQRMRDMCCDENGVYDDSLEEQP